jgi:hypothetical protein
VFPVGKTTKAGPQGLTQELAAQPARMSTVSTWVKLMSPILAVGVVIVLIFVVFRGGWQTPTWQSAQRNLSPAKSYDSEFEDFVIRAYRQDNMTADVRVCDGICLINVSKDVPSGLLRRFATKLGALGIACPYAALRKNHGDDPVATVTIFINGRRYVGATCDSRKHPEWVR